MNYDRGSEAVSQWKISIACLWVACVAGGFYGWLTRKPGTRVKTSSEAAGKWGEGNEKPRSETRLRRDCRCSLPISPATPPLVLAWLSRPPKPPTTQASLWGTFCFSRFLAALKLGREQNSPETLAVGVDKR